MMSPDSPSMLMIAKTISGLEPVLKAELETAGAKGAEIMNRSVSFEGDMACLYRTNFTCRSALRILLPISVFEIKEQDDLYRNIREIRWEDYLETGSTLAVDAVISYTVFTNSQYVAQKTKDAVVDRLRSIRGQRPSVDLHRPDLRINVHLFRDTCTVSLDSSGESLHKRGYRKQTGPAPINEVLAAGLILLSGWDRQIPFLDPMCGSGTFLIEAVMMALGLPSGFYRQEFGFMKWKDYDPALWNKVREEALSSADFIPLIREHGSGSEGKKGIMEIPKKSSDPKIRIFGFDRSYVVLKKASENLKYSGLEKFISIEKKGFGDSVPPAAKGFIIMNPPYDERLPLNDSAAFYKMIGDVLKRKYTAYKAWVISSDLEAIKFIGLKPSRKYTVFNGPLECRFAGFDLYEGKKNSTFTNNS